MSGGCHTAPRGPSLEFNCFYSREWCVWKLNSTTGCNCLQPQSVMGAIWLVCDAGLDPFRNKQKPPPWEGDASRPNSILVRLKLPPGCSSGASAKVATLHMQIISPLPHSLHLLDRRTTITELSVSQSYSWARSLLNPRDSQSPSQPAVCSRKVRTNLSTAILSTKCGPR